MFIPYHRNMYLRHTIRDHGEVVPLGVGGFKRLVCPSSTRSTQHSNPPPRLSLVPYIVNCISSTQSSFVCLRVTTESARVKLRRRMKFRELELPLWEDEKVGEGGEDEQVQGPTAAAADATISGSNPCCVTAPLQLQVTSKPPGLSNFIAR